MIFRFSGNSASFLNTNSRQFIFQWCFVAGFPLFVRHHPPPGYDGRTFPSSGHQLPAQQVQVGQAHQHVHLSSILHQPAVAGPGESKLPLEHPEYMFYPRPDRGVLPVTLLLTLREILSGLAFVLYSPAYSKLPRSPFVFVAGVARIAKNNLVFRPQQLQ